MASAARQSQGVPPLIPGIDDDNLLAAVADAIGTVRLPDDPSCTITWRYAKHVSDELARKALAAVREEIRSYRELGLIPPLREGELEAGLIRTETACLGAVPATKAELEAGLRDAIEGMRCEREADAMDGRPWGKGCEGLLRLNRLEALLGLPLTGPEA